MGHRENQEKAKPDVRKSTVSKEVANAERRRLNLALTHVCVSLPISLSLWVWLWVCVWVCEYGCVGACVRGWMCVNEIVCVCVCQ